ncbi:MAG: hypothetical protein KatS3mg108_2976 [Isosphaeraceae bacterium]|jgi:hypothetical protein|nr:MAG: hypothetical protein KatS3mg108_2976 [Isosphaeraceae bacterium]
MNPTSDPAVTVPTASGDPPPASPPSEPAAQLAAAAPEQPFELKLYGESKIDKVSSLLLSFIVSVSLAVGWLGIMYITQQAYAARPPAKIEIIEVLGGGGGSPDVDPASIQQINIAGGDPEKQASNNMEDASEFEDPAVELTTEAVIDAFIETVPEEVVNLDMAEEIPGAVAVASGVRASKIGNAAVGYGFGGGVGEGGVARENRWSIVYPPGQTVDEYARQLDFFGIELAVPTGSNSLEYVSRFSTGSPVRRSAVARSDGRLYFLWQGGNRKEADMDLLQRAGVAVGNKPIFQFYPKDVEDQLAQLEVQFAGRQPIEIASTRFTVVAAGNGYQFKVIEQTPLR